MSSNIFIPSPEMRTRIVNLGSHCVMYNRSSGKPLFSQVPMEEVYSDQWWHIIPVTTGSHAGKYLIKNTKTNRLLYCRDSYPQTATIDGEGKYDDNYFILEPGKGHRSGFVRLTAPSSGRVVVGPPANNKPDRLAGDTGHFPSYPAEYSSDYDDQWWAFLAEDLTFAGIEFHMDDSAVEGTMPCTIGKETVDNKGETATQEIEVTFTETEDNEYTFECASSTSISIGDEFEVGIPGIMDGKVSMSVSHTEEFKWGETTRTGKGHQYTFPVTAPPKTLVTAYGLIKRSAMIVPYTMTLKSKQGIEAKLDGILRCMQGWDVKCTFEETKL